MMAYKVKYAQALSAKQQGREPLKPLRTFKELAEEFGLSVAELRVLFAHHSAPKPQFGRATKLYNNSWYDPDEVREWYKRVTEEAS